jgi:hypothetical protein
MFGTIALTSTIITVFGYKTFRLVKDNTIHNNHSSSVVSEGQPGAPASATAHHRTLDPWKVYPFISFKVTQRRLIFDGCYQ